MNVKPLSVPTLKRLPNLPGPKISTIEYDLCTDDEQKAVILPPSTPPPTPNDDTDLQAEIQLLRGLLVSKRREANPGVILKHAYGAVNGTIVSNSAGFIVTVNGIAQGTGTSQRLGDNIVTKSLTIRLIMRVEPEALLQASLNNLTPPNIRVCVWREKVPVVSPPLLANWIEYTSAAPTSSNVWLTSSGAAASGQGNMTAFRSPLTYEKFHVYHDKVYAMDKYQLTSVSPTSGAAAVWVESASKHLDLHIETHNAESEYAANTSASVITNMICFGVLTDRPTGNPMTIEWTCDTVFADSSS